MSRFSIRRILIVLFVILVLSQFLSVKLLLIPRMTHLLMEEEKISISQQLGIIADSIEPFLLSRQYAAVIETLSYIEEQNARWVSLEFELESGRQLYPLGGRGPVTAAQTLTVSQDLVRPDRFLGKITTTVDLTPLVLRLEKEVNRNATLFLAGVTVLIGLMAILFERILVSPLSSLTRAADVMVKGDFQFPVDAIGSREIKRLRRSFLFMRNQIKTQTEDLTTARQAAEKALRVRSDFLARMSHEVRTPMNGVLPVAEHLRDSDLSSDQLRQVDTILEAGRSLLSIVDDILELAKLEQGKITPKSEPFYLMKLIDGTTRILQSLATEKSLALTYQVDPELENAAFVGDYGRLRQILVNLIGNALKFTDEGSVTLTVSQCAVSERISFCIEDTGMGIPPEDHDRIFQSFEQAPQGLNAQKGSGLGLAITHSLVTMLGGEISLSSTPGKGSCFNVRLPMTRASAKDLAREGDIAFSLPEGGLATLVVDDNATNRLVAKAMLKRMGYRVDCVNNGRAAVSAVQSGRYDLILMDMHMPVMDGLEATRAIRTLSADLGQTKIIAVTASVLEEDQQKCRDAGMNAVLCKPINKKSLTHAIKTVLH